MRPRSILLRLLLCLVLLANGASAAFANTRMAVEAGATTAALLAGEEIGPPCHDMGTDLSTVADFDAPSSPASPTDCCQPGACLCSCLAQSTAILSVHAVTLAEASELAPRPAP